MSESQGVKSQRSEVSPQRSATCHSATLPSVLLSFYPSAALPLCHSAAR